MRFRLGVVLEVPASDASPIRNPLLILADEPAVSTISRQAHLVLAVEKTDSAYLLLDESLHQANGNLDRVDLAPLLKLVGTMPGDGLRRAVDTPRPVFGARVRSRGQPPAVPFGVAPLSDPVDRPPSNGDAGSPATNGNSAAASTSRPAACESRESGPALKQEQHESRESGPALKQEQHDRLDRIVAEAGEVGALLGDLGPDDLDRALAVVAEARCQLDQTERQLVRLAVQAGRSWARIGVALGITTGRATHERFA